MTTLSGPISRWPLPVITSLALTLPGACADDPPRSGEPPDEPVLELVALTGAGAQGWSAGSNAECVELGRDPSGTVIAELSLEGDWLLRPLHNCQSRTRCGFIEVAVSDTAGNVLMTRAAAALAINLPLGELPNPTGTFVFSARLLNQDGEVYSFGDGGTACANDACQATLTVAQYCDGTVPTDAANPPSDAASDGAPPMMAPDPIDAGIGDAASDASSVDSGSTGSDAAVVGDGGDADADAGDGG